MNTKHLHILRHSLGLDDNGRGNQYRNRYVCGPGHHGWSDCEELRERGLMIRHEPRELFGGDYCFMVTDAGKAAVEAAKPPPIKTTRSQRRMQLFRSLDCGLSFREFLNTSWAKGVK